jgi:hypothetical protein
LLRSGTIIQGERLPAELLIGAVLRPREEPGDSIAPDNFAANTAFLNLLHRIIGRDGPETKQLRESAESIGDGKVYVIDGRAPKPQPRKEWVVSSEDILGEFDVKDGEIVPGSYRPNPGHRLFSSQGRGFFQLEDEFAQYLIAELDSIPEPEGDYVAGGWDLIH